MRILLDNIVSINNKTQSCEFIVPLTRYDYVCNDTVITISNKLRVIFNVNLPL